MVVQMVGVEIRTVHAVLSSRIVLATTDSEFNICQGCFDENREARCIFDQRGRMGGIGVAEIDDDARVPLS